MNKINLPAFDDMPTKKVSNFQGVEFNTRPVPAPTEELIEEEVEEVTTVESKPQESNVVNINTATKGSSKKIKKEKKELDTSERLEYYKYNEDGEVVGINTGLYVESIAFRVPAISVHGDFYLYKNGYYQKCDEEDALEFLTGSIHPAVRTYGTMSDISKQWHVHYHIRKKPHQVNADPYKLNLTNGIYNLATGEFAEGHSANDLMTHRVHANYNPNLSQKDGEVWHKFLDYALPDKHTQMVLQEVMGYCVTQFVDAKKFFVFDGISNSGKSKIIEFLVKLLDPTNVSHVPIQDLKGFNLAELHNKLLNTFADLPAKPIDDANLIKIMTGDDDASAERKFKTRISFKNIAKMLFSTNGMPKNYGDKSTAFYNRLIIIPFNNAVTKENRDKDLPYKLQKEKDYIFMWMLEGLERLIENGFVFTEADEINSAVKNYMEDGNTVIQFVKDKCSIQEDKKMQSLLLFKDYKKYCKDELGIDGMGKNNFFRELKEKFPELRYYKSGPDYYFKGIIFGKTKEQEAKEAAEIFNEELDEAMEALGVKAPKLEF
ncbi:phage/plasmid primase, P4 family [Paenibacillus sp. TAB 01]|uniref:DNA primase family protein n=1 Tax=Paenibacillus sp. TAB 01 TaxID=3368988 RepID=UPI003750C316